MSKPENSEWQLRRDEVLESLVKAKGMGKR